jgi:hypothetical protein
MCDCAETMQAGARFLSPEGDIKTVQIRIGDEIVATRDGASLMEDKYNLKETELHVVNCPEGGYPY